MKKPIQLGIPSPCAQRWDEMTPDGCGRYCTHCQKTVVDFTTWSDAAIYRFLEQKSGNVCGRLRTSQMNRPLAAPYQPHSRLYHIFAALGLTLVFAQAPAAAQNRPPGMEQSWLRSVDTGTAKNGSIAGRIVNKKGTPVAQIAVRVSRSSGIVCVAVTDADGNYRAENLEAGFYDVRAYVDGSDTAGTNALPVKVDQVTTCHLVVNGFQTVQVLPVEDIAGGLIVTTVIIRHDAFEAEEQMRKLKEENNHPHSLKGPEFLHR